VKERAAEFRERLCISTGVLAATRGETLLEAIQMVKAAGFQGLELVTAAFGSPVGFPEIVPNLPLWPREFTKPKRAELKKHLASFKTLSVHAQGVGLNIAYLNPGLREESQKQYIEAIELAVDLGISVITFHCGFRTGNQRLPQETYAKYDIEFARRAVPLAEEHDLLLGYESGPFERLKRVIAEVNHPRFGINLDIGHAAMAGVNPEEWIRHFGEKIVEVHLNSATRHSGGFIEHQPVERNNVIDYEAVFAGLKRINYQGPLVLELLGVDIALTLDVARRGAQIFTEIWDKV
jgi:sugar phosphate isomerase/epimerase